MSNQTDTPTELTAAQTRLAYRALVRAMCSNGDSLSDQTVDVVLAHPQFGLKESHFIPPHQHGTNTSSSKNSEGTTTLGSSPTLHGSVSKNAPPPAFHSCKNPICVVSDSPHHPTHAELSLLASPDSRTLRKLHPSSTSRLNDQLHRLESHLIEGSESNSKLLATPLTDYLQGKSLHEPASEFDTRRVRQVVSNDLGNPWHLDVVGSEFHMLWGYKVFVSVDPVESYKHRVISPWERIVEDATDSDSEDESEAQNHGSQMYALKWCRKLVSCPSFRWTIAKPGDTVTLRPDCRHASWAVHGEPSNALARYIVHHADLPRLAVSWLYFRNRTKSSKEEENAVHHATWYVPDVTMHSLPKDVNNKSTIEQLSESLLKTLSTCMERKQLSASDLYHLQHSVKQVNARFEQAKHVNFTLHSEIECFIDQFNAITQLEEPLRWPDTLKNTIETADNTIETVVTSVSKGKQANRSRKRTSDKVASIRESPAKVRSDFVVEDDQVDVQNIGGLRMCDANSFEQSPARPRSSVETPFTTPAASLVDLRKRSAGQRHDVSRASPADDAEETASVTDELHSVDAVKDLDHESPRKHFARSPNKRSKSSHNSTKPTNKELKVERAIKLLDEIAIADDAKVDTPTQLTTTLDVSKQHIVTALQDLNLDACSEKQIMDKTSHMFLLSRSLNNMHWAVTVAIAQWLLKLHDKYARPGNGSYQKIADAVCGRQVADRYVHLGRLLRDFPFFHKIDWESAPTTAIRSFRTLASEIYDWISSQANLDSALQDKIAVRFLDCASESMAVSLHNRIADIYRMARDEVIQLSIGGVSDKDGDAYGELTQASTNRVIGLLVTKCGASEPRPNRPLHLVDCGSALASAATHIAALLPDLMVVAIEQSPELHNHAVLRNQKWAKKHNMEHLLGSLKLVNGDFTEGCKSEVRAADIIYCFDYVFKNPTMIKLADLLQSPTASWEFLISSRTLTSWRRDYGMECLTEIDSLTELPTVQNGGKHTLYLYQRTSAAKRRKTTT